MNGLQMKNCLVFLTAVLIASRKNSRLRCSPLIICKFKVSVKTIMVRTRFRSVIWNSVVGNFDSSDFESGPEWSDTDFEILCGSILRSIIQT